MNILEQHPFAALLIFASVASPLLQSAYGYLLAALSRFFYIEAHRFCFSRGQREIKSDRLYSAIFACFHGRKNVTSNGFSFDTLLNAIQGVEQEDGLLLFVTTNHLDQVDPALGRPENDGQSTRPGRIDTVVEMGSMDGAGRLKIARRILRDERLALQIVSEDPAETPAQLTDRCKRLARDVLWGRA